MQATTALRYGYPRKPKRRRRFALPAHSKEATDHLRFMSRTEDHRWDLSEDEDGNLPESDEAFEQKMEEWAARDWPQWLARQLAFPFTVTREEDDWTLADCSDGAVGSGSRYTRPQSLLRAWARCWELLFLARLSALAAGSHSRGSRGQAGRTGDGAAFAGGFGASKVADLSRRQNSFLLAWRWVPSPVLRFLTTL